MLDKQQLERMYVHNMKVRKVLFIVSMCLFGAAALALTGFIIFQATGYDIVLIPEYIVDFTLKYVCLDLFETFLAGALVLLLFSRLIFGRRAMMAKAMLDNFDQIYAEQSRVWNSMPSAAPIVDAKPVNESKPKGKYDDLINEYEKLYNQGLITKEELDNKKKELGY